MKGRSTVRDWWKEPNVGVLAPIIFKAYVLDSDPNEWVLVFNKAVTATNLGWTLDIDAAPATITGIAGSGTSTLILTTTETVADGEALTISYNGAAGDCLSVSSSTELANITDRVVINNVLP